MPDVQHNTLTGSEIHEPKGADSANANEVYVADGLGSGSWTYFPTGWGYYEHGGADQTFDSTGAFLDIDGAGGNTETSYLPPEIRGSDHLWDTTNDLITPITIGDSYDLRFDLPVKSTATSPSYLFWQLDIGGSTSVTNKIAAGTAVIAKTAPFEITIAIPIFTLSTFKTNGGQLFLATDAGTVTIENPTVYISRNHAGDI